MNIGEILLTAAPSIGVGVVIGAALRGKAIAKVRDIVAAKDRAIEGANKVITKRDQDLAAVDLRNSELRESQRDLERQLGRERAEIARLKPLADKAEASQRQRVAASHTAAEKRVAAIAASKATTTPPTSPATPKRKTRAK